VRPTTKQIAEYMEMIEAGIAVEAAMDEAFPDDGAIEMRAGRPARLKSFYTVTDDGWAVAWDTCAKCHMHISICKCREIKIPEYIERWAARRRGMVLDPITNRVSPPLLEIPRTPVVVADDLPLEGCMSCGQRITPSMAHTGAYVEMDVGDGADMSPYAISVVELENPTVVKWTCSDCINQPKKEEANGST
jgi:hypothetical protein